MLDLVATGKRFYNGEMTKDVWGKEQKQTIVCKYVLLLFLLLMPRLRKKKIAKRQSYVMRFIRSDLKNGQKLHQ